MNISKTIQLFEKKLPVCSSIMPFLSQKRRSFFNDHAGEREVHSIPKLQYFRQENMVFRWLVSFRTLLWGKIWHVLTTRYLKLNGICSKKVITGFKNYFMLVFTLYSILPHVKFKTSFASFKVRSRNWLIPKAFFVVSKCLNCGYYCWWCPVNFVMSLTHDYRGKYFVTMWILLARVEIKFRANDL